jgi:hypothetical protein
MSGVDIMPLLKTTIRILLLLALTQTAVSFAADKDIVELQREVALLQHDLRSLQRSPDQGLGGTKLWRSRGRVHADARRKIPLATPSFTDRHEPAS